MDISLFRKTVIAKVTDVTENYSDKRPGYNRIDVELEDGSSSFIILSQAETDKIPFKDGYADFTGVAKIRTWTKGSKKGSYLERINPLPALNKTSTGGWTNPWAKK